MDELGKDGQSVTENKSNQTTQIIALRSLDDASRLIRTGFLPNIKDFLGEADVLVFGDRHIDYAIPKYILTQVGALKNAGITSFGFEVHPDPKNQEVIDSINAGNLDRIAEIDWALGFGNPLVRQLKERLVRELVKAGIAIYPFASWSDQEGIEKTPYSAESEKQAGRIISARALQGKTAVLVGAQHAQYREGINTRTWSFPHTADCIKATGKKIKSLIFAGGMHIPLDDDRSAEKILSRVSRDTVKQPLFIDTSKTRIDRLIGDGILILPVVLFLAANKPIQ